MIINDLDGYYIVFDTKNWNTELDTLSIISCSKLSIPFFNFMLSFYTYYPHPSVYHQYSILTILQVVTPISFLKKYLLSLVSR